MSDSEAPVAGEHVYVSHLVGHHLQLVATSVFTRGGAQVDLDDLVALTAANPVGRHHLPAQPRKVPAVSRLTEPAPQGAEAFETVAQLREIHWRIKTNILFRKKEHPPPRWSAGAVQTVAAALSLAAQQGRPVAGQRELVAAVLLQIHPETGDEVVQGILRHDGEARYEQPWAPALIEMEEVGLLQASRFTKALNWLGAKLGVASEVPVVQVAGVEADRQAVRRRADRTGVADLIAALASVAHVTRAVKAQVTGGRFDEAGSLLAAAGMDYPQLNVRRIGETGSHTEVGLGLPVARDAAAAALFAQANEARVADAVQLLSLIVSTAEGEAAIGELGGDVASVRDQLAAIG